MSNSANVVNTSVTVVTDVAKPTCVEHEKYNKLVALFKEISTKMNDREKKVKDTKDKLESVQAELFKKVGKKLKTSNSSNSNDDESIVKELDGAVETLKTKHVKNKTKLTDLKSKFVKKIQCEKCTGDSCPN